jgi:hypothetical protein
LNFKNGQRMDERGRLLSLLKALIKTTASLADDHPLKSYYQHETAAIACKISKLKKKRHLAQDLMDRWHDDAVQMMEGREELDWVYKMNSHPYYEGVKLLHDYDERAGVANLKKLWTDNAPFRKIK